MIWDWHADGKDHENDGNDDDDGDDDVDDDDDLLAMTAIRFLMHLHRCHLTRHTADILIVTKSASQSPYIFKWPSSYHPEPPQANEKGDTNEIERVQEGRKNQQRKRPFQKAKN